MSFLLNILSTIVNKIFSTSGKTNTNENTEKVEFIKPNNAIADAYAAIIWICVVCLAVYWITQYLFADYVWIKSCLQANALVPFPIDVQKLFDMIYSLLGLGGVGIMHGVIRKLMK